MPWALLLDKVKYLEQPVGAITNSASVVSSIVWSPAASGDKNVNTLAGKQAPDLAIILGGALVLLMAIH